MTDTDWKEEAGMGAEPPVPESPVIPPVAEGTEPGAGELPQQGVPAEPVQESPAGQLDGPEEASSDLLPDSGAPVGAAEPAGETNGPASAPSQPGESGEQVYEEPVADAPVGEQMEEPIPQDAFAEGATSEAPNGAVPEAAPERRRRQAHSQAPGWAGATRDYPPGKGPGYLQWGAHPGHNAGWAGKRSPAGIWRAPVCEPLSALWTVSESLHGFVLRPAAARWAVSKSAGAVCTAVSAAASILELPAAAGPAADGRCDASAASPGGSRGRTRRSRAAR